MTFDTLRQGGPAHWGVMLARGWKGELAETGRSDSWLVARDWARRAEHLGFDGVWVFDHFQPYPGRQPCAGGMDYRGRVVAGDGAHSDRHARVVCRLSPS